LPDLGTVEFVLVQASRAARGPAAELARTILASGMQLQQPWESAEGKP
jgi:hypothetical protein